MKIIKIEKCGECDRFVKSDGFVKCFCKILFRQVNPETIDPKCPLDDMPDIRLVDVETDNPRLELNGETISYVKQIADNTWCVFSLTGSSYFNKKEYAIKAMCKKFGVGGLIK